MDKPLSLKQLSEIIERNPAALSVVAGMPRITVDDIAYAISSTVIRGIAATTDRAAGFLSMISESCLRDRGLSMSPVHSVVE